MATPRGRSKGCLTCRERRVKCDEGRPTCQRCRKGFFHCKGYAKNWVFRHDGTWLRSPGKPVELPEEDHDSPINTAPISHCFRPSPSSEPAHLSPVISLAITSASRKHPLPSLPSTLSLDAFKEEIVISHFVNKMLVATMEAKTQDHGGLPWHMHVLPSLCEDRLSTKYLSVLALSVGYFARVHKNVALQRNGDRIYGQALNRLINDMKNSQAIDWRSNSFSPLCLCMYELIRAPEPLSWLQHSSGMAAVTEMMGPRAFQGSVANENFYVYRGFITAGYLARRKRCFLERPEWKTVPFALITTPRSVGSRIQDVLCDVPGLVEDADILRTLSANGKTATTVEYGQALRDKASAAIRQLYDLRWEWDDEFSHTCYEVVTQRGTTICVDESGEPLFRTVLFFHEMQRAVDIASFDVLFLILCDILSAVGGNPDFIHTARTALSTPSSTQMSAVKPELPSSSGQTSGSLLLPGQMSREAMAREICRLVDYCLQSKHDSRGVMTLINPLRMAYKNLSGDMRVRRWLERTFRDIAASKGFEIGNHVANYLAFSRPSTP